MAEQLGPVLVATDLDRTAVYSAAASALPPEAAVDLVGVETYRGALSSFMTTEAARLAVELGRQAVLVPTTTRTREQLARVELPGRSRHAVGANGGLLLLDGVPDPAWTARVTDTLDATGMGLPQVHEHLLTVFQDAWTHVLRVADDLFCYAVVDRAAMPAEVVPALADWAAQGGWSVSLQGRKVYVVPSGLTKSAAVSELAGRLGARLVLAAGDSLLDADLLERADAAVRPAHGELHDAGWTRPHVVVTPRRGVLGGEDVMAWLLGRARDVPSGAR